jgi:hypothetical protein
MGGVYVVLLWSAGASLFSAASNLLIPFILVQVGYVLGLMTRETYEQVLARLNTSSSKRV